MPCSRWHQVVKLQRIDWIIIWFDPVTCELSSRLQQVPKVCAGIVALQHNSHLAMTAVGVTVIPQWLYNEEQLWKARGTSSREDELSLWVPQWAGWVSLSPHVSLGQSCLFALNWEHDCVERHMSSARAEKDHSPSWQAHTVLGQETEKQPHSLHCLRGAFLIEKKGKKDGCILFTLFEMWTALIQFLCQVHVR